VKPGGDPNGINRWVEDEIDAYQRARVAARDKGAA
jgi:predicted DNA-binding transcriptional regulator AlpA